MYYYTVLWSPADTTWEPSQCEDAPRVPQQCTQALAYKISLCPNSVLIEDMKLSDYLEVCVLS